MMGTRNGCNGGLRAAQKRAGRPLAFAGLSLASLIFPGHFEHRSNSRVTGGSYSFFVAHRSRLEI